MLATYGSLTAIAATLLAISQFVDYKGVRAGFSAYHGVTNVVTAPIIDGTRATAGSAHLFLLLPVAALAAWALLRVLGGRLESVRVLIATGVIGIGVSLVIDLPKGLNEGGASIDHADAHASLLAGFWVQLTSSALLVLCGLLLLRCLTPANPT